ncbi:hypothetical protein ACWCQP_49790 [Streptomyces chartreusis]
MSSTTNAARSAVLTVVGGVLTVLVSGALGIQVQKAQEADRRATVEQFRPDAPAPLPDPFLDWPRR